MGNKRYPKKKKKSLQRLWCVLWLKNAEVTKIFTTIYIQINVAIDVIDGLINESLIYFLLVGEASLFVVWQLENAIYIIASLWFLKLCRKKKKWQPHLVSSCTQGWLENCKELHQIKIEACFMLDWQNHGTDWFT